MIRRLIEMYDNGSITGYQLMMDCFQMLDPDNPDPILSELPEDVLEEMLAYGRRYDPRRPHSATSILPAEDQVTTAERWICSRQAMRSKPVNQ